jgi:hypothetical protein
MIFGKFGIKVWICLNLGVIVEGSKPLPSLVTPCIYTRQLLPFCFHVFDYDFHIIICWLQYNAISWIVFHALWPMVVTLIFEVHMGHEHLIMLDLKTRCWTYVWHAFKLCVQVLNVCSCKSQSLQWLASSVKSWCAICDVHV